MKNKWISLVSLGLTLGMCSQSYAYVMVRSGFGELKGTSFKGLSKSDAGINIRKGAEIANILNYEPVCNTGNIKYTNHHNLSVAFGGRFDVLDIGAVGVELEILGGYASVKKREPLNVMVEGFNAPYKPDFVVRKYRCIDDRGVLLYHNKVGLFYLSNQRIAGAQVNIYWEQYLLDNLSVGVMGGIGGAYVCTKFTTLEQLKIHTGGGGAWVNAIPATQGRKYIHTGSLLYNFSLFARAEMFETLFEVGYRHIGLHQMFGAKCYGREIPKLGNMYSDQVYLGIGRTF